MAPGGHLYLYNEPDEADFLDDREVDVQDAQPVPPADVRCGLALAGARGRRLPHGLLDASTRANLVVLAQVDGPVRRSRR
jgi:hypothetical protein